MGFRSLLPKSFFHTPVERSVAQRNDYYSYPSTYDMMSPFYEIERFFEEVERRFFQPMWTSNDFREMFKLGSSNEELKVTDDYISLKMDVSQFHPNELRVNIADGYIVIEGRHQEMYNRHGMMQRAFIRRYVLPSNVREEDVVSDLSKDGILTITGKKTPSIEGKKRRNIPIEYK
ncbi:Protein lethal(2)essential for life [Strongyloides ratti]|uniref:Protein lethal(2)essential for life n=1 Tax=Strongyloides ratti TaxID=34506 RepID=A0A090L0N5_STRRB|nr:Protein lethal(2)essential for life [Strongyloides ratti]CEF63216.1 Protein lethal(2)essential for life [Strongyloides ratti]